MSAVNQVFTLFDMSTPVINKGIMVLIIDCLFDLDRLFDSEIKMSKFKWFLVFNKKGWKSAFSITIVIYNNKWRFQRLFHSCIVWLLVLVSKYCFLIN